MQRLSLLGNNDNNPNNDNNTNNDNKGVVNEKKVMILMKNELLILY